MENNASNNLEQSAFKDQSALDQSAFDAVVSEHPRPESVVLESREKKDDDENAAPSKPKRRKIHDFKNAEGPIWDEKSKRWLVRFTWYEENAHGKKVRMDVKRTFRRKRDADKFYAETEESIILGTYSQQRQSKKLTFGEVSDRYLAAKRTLRYFPMLKSRLNGWITNLGRDTRLGDISEPMLENSRTELIQRGLKEGTVDQYVIAIKCFYNWLLRRKEFRHLDNPSELLELFHPTTDGAVG